MARSSDLTEKDMSTVREADVAKVQRERHEGELRDYTLNHKVVMKWDLNADAMRDQMFKLVIDDKIEVILDWEQMLRYGRWI